MSGPAKAGALIVSATLCAAIAFGGRVPWTPQPDGSALVRLSWRAVLPTIEDCHEPTEDELTGLPPHMRPTEICDGRPVPFRLRFVLDGETVVDEPVTGAGAREDRPMYVLHEVQVEPGTHHIEVVFGPDEQVTLPSSAVGGSVLSREIEIEALDIALVTTDAQGALVVRRGL